VQLEKSAPLVLTICIDPRKEGAVRAAGVSGGPHPLTGRASHDRVAYMSRSASVALDTGARKIRPPKSRRLRVAYEKQTAYLSADLKPAAHSNTSRPTKLRGVLARGPGPFNVFKIYIGNRPYLPERVLTNIADL